MATCRICGQVFGIKSPDPNVCNACWNNPQHFEEATAEVRRSNAEMQERLQAINDVLLTTEVVTDLRVLKRIEVISAEVAYGMNIFKDLFADVRNIVGGRSKAVQNTMRDARRTALYELKKEAYEVGANAVVGVDLDYVELSAHSTMVMLVATGTAVVIEK
jgi:uncharacterized protein YbjQ (UPF0145 family)